MGPNIYFKVLPAQNMSTFHSFALMGAATHALGAISHECQLFLIIFLFSLCSLIGEKRDTRVLSPCRLAHRS